MAIIKSNRHLESRSRLIFSFPQEAGGAIPVRVCPFFENPIIREKRSSNLVKYDILGRNGNMVGFTGSKSRQLTVDFNITLDHVFALASQNFSSEKIGNIPSEDDKKAEFFKKVNDDSEELANETLWGKKRKELLTLLNNDKDPASTKPDDASPELEFAMGTNNGYAASHLFAQTVEIIHFWINLIRSSTMNNSQNPALGPPLIRLQHGILYNRICTVAENYSITVDEQAGYDVVSLLPKRIKITLNLIEIQKNHTTDASEPEEVIYGWEQSLDNTLLKKVIADDDYLKGSGNIWDNIYGK